MTPTYQRRLDAAVIALRRGWFKRLETVARVFEVPERAVRARLLETKLDSASRRV